MAEPTAARDHFIELAFADGTAARWAVTANDIALAADLIENELDTPGMASTADVPRPDSGPDEGYVELTRADGSVRHWAITDDESDALAELLEERVGAADTLVC